ncbi:MULTISPECIES: cyclic nucleotide-binding/CBS domain-containing protein [Legionella]|uniref:Hypoxic response protein 1 n=1 Tax=Legionella maceachernii TaxID=466 RepID=A0A0W0WCY0_9GAMM|nr:CBS domain-containing protein [Legionella maceachernii]KTD30188.1 Hypoxic response protein 1 [Legionella maceachernii]SJZ92688.1 CBS domain-containing protein [Legionella maceachernii]SUP03509.1 Hypoxic response protein 1 [Legionella maceachernii]
MAHLIYSALPQPRRPIVYVNPKITVAQCIDIMIKENIGAVVVFEGKNLMGMVTERDIVRSCLQQALDPNKATAADVVYTDVSVLNLFDPVEKAMETITETKRRHVLIEENGEIVAILSIGDLLFHLLEDKTRVIEQLENYIHTY